MSARLRGALLSLPLLLAVGCSSSLDVNSVQAPNAGDPGGSTSATNVAVWDPTTSSIPLPNVLLTAGQAPFNPATELHAGVALDPVSATRWVNTEEMGGLNAVSGLNAPIYLTFSQPVSQASLQAGIKVFQLIPDANGTETGKLGFRDVSALFTFKVLGQPDPATVTPGGDPTTATATSGANEVEAFPNFPLQPGTRYAYFVTTSVKDSATGQGVGRSVGFGFASQSTPLVDGSGHSTTVLPDAQAQQLEQIRGNVAGPGGTVAFSGYAKLLADLTASAAHDASGKAASGAGATGIASTGAVSVMGRFITTGAMATYTDPSNPASLAPIDALLRGFASAGLPGSPFPGAVKQWDNTLAGVTPIPAATFFTGAGLPPAAFPHVATVVVGSFTSANLSVEPTKALNFAANAAGTDATTLQAGAYAQTTGFTIQTRSATTGQLEGFYNTPQAIPFLYFVPTSAKPAGGYPVLIFQHGISGQKENAIALAESVCSTGHAVLAIDLPDHGALGGPGLTGNSGDPLPGGLTKGQAWTANFMSLTSVLTGRTNIQQAALNLHRLEILVRAGVFGAYLPTMAPSQASITYSGQSLGSVVGTYYLSGNTTLSTTGAPYSAASLANDMKGFLSVPGGRIAYLLKTSPSFGNFVYTNISAALTAQLQGAGLTPGTPAFIAAFRQQYQSFFLLVQGIVDPVDPASNGLPLAAGLPSRFAGRIAVQEAVSSHFDVNGSPTDGDLVIPNTATDYFLNSFAGWGAVFGPSGDFDPGFQQLAYGNGTVPHPVLFTQGAGGIAPKVGTAAIVPTASTPTQGLFQFNQAGIDHAFLLDNKTPANTALGQKQLLFFLGAGGGGSIVVDPTAF